MLSTAEDYQHIEFGVDEVMNSKSGGVNEQLYKVSSTLNPQAPEFILGCQSAQKSQQTAPPTADVPDGTHFNSLDGPDLRASALDNHQTSQGMDGLPGSLGQRERKKKKKRPPGYYNYLDLSVGSSSNSGAADCMPVTALVNGHALSGPHHSAEGVDGKPLTGAELSIQGPVSALTSADDVVVVKSVTKSTANQRTCDSPDEFSLDLTSGSASLSDGNNATFSSSDSSQSRGMTEGQRTAEQQLDHLALQSPELSDSPHSPDSKSPVPPSAVASLSESTPITTTELEGRVLADSEVTNGLADPDAPVSADGQKEDFESQEEAEQSSPDSGAQSVGIEQAHSPAVPAAPFASLPKSWASLFHNSKPLPGGPQAFVEVKNVVEVVSPSVATEEQPEKVVEEKDGPVHVSEDPMAPKLAGIIWRCS